MRPLSVPAPVPVNAPVIAVKVRLPDTLSESSIVALNDIWYRTSASLKVPLRSACPDAC